MRLLLFTDYALRVLLYVATHPRAPVPASTIAAAYGISPDHVAKATKTLTREGFLRATRGAMGGVELARPAESICVGDVVRAFERESGVVSCLQEDGAECRIERVCRLRHVFARAEAAFFDELDRWTLADLLGNKQPLVRLLRSPSREER
jgi:Rrf2 family nitric oxide-sensitive transcriptional repressor